MTCAISLVISAGRPQAVSKRCTMSLHHRSEARQSIRPSAESDDVPKPTAGEKQPDAPKPTSAEPTGSTAGDKWQELLGLLSVDSAAFKAEELTAELKDFSQFGKRGEAWFAAQALLIILIAFPPVNLDVLVRVMAGMGALLGLLIIVAGSNSLGRSLSPLPAPRAANELITDGMFKYCRHPLYTGLIMAIVGASIVTESETRLLFSAVLAAVLWNKSALEERMLVEKYGVQYEEYAARVKRFLVF